MAQQTTYLPATTTDAIIATSLVNYRRKMIDNIFELSIFLNRLRERGRVRIEDGGASITEHIMYEKSTAKGWYSGDGPLSTAAQEGFRLAEYQWRQAYATIIINGLEEIQNKGRHKLISLLEAKSRQAELSLMDLLGGSDGLFATSRATNAANTLVTLIDATSIIGGINRAGTGNSFWQATSTTSGSAAAQLITDMRTLFNTLTINGRSPHMAVTTRTVLGYYEGLLTPQERFTDSKMADAGFQNLKFKNIPVFFDPNCNSGVMYMPNLDSMGMVVEKDHNFAVTPFIKPLNQDVKGAQILWYGNFTGNEWRLDGKLISISA